MAANQTYGGASVIADALDTGSNSARRGASIGAKLGTLGGFFSSWMGVIGGGGAGVALGLLAAFAFSGPALIIAGIGALVGMAVGQAVISTIGAVGGWLAGGAIGGISGFTIGAVESKSNQRRMAVEAKHMQQQYRIAMEQGRRAGQMAMMQRMESQVAVPPMQQQLLEQSTAMSAPVRFEEERLENEFVNAAEPQQEEGQRPKVVERVLAEGRKGSPVKNIVSDGPSASAVERALENAQQSTGLER